MTQKEVAEMAGLSVLTVYRFENGSVTNIALSSFLLLLKAVGCINDLSELMPEQPESPYLYKERKKIQRKDINGHERGFESIPMGAGDRTFGVARCSKNVILHV